MGLFKRFSFNAKLLALCLFMSVVSVVIGGIAYKGLQDVGHSYAKITEQVMPKLEAANEMFIEYRRIRITLRTLGLPGLSPLQAEEAVHGAVDAMTAYEKADIAYRGHGFIEGQKEIYDEVHASWLVFRGIGEKVLALQKSGRAEDHQTMIKIFFTDCPAAAKNYTAAMTKLLEFHKNSSRFRTIETQQQTRETNLLVLVIGVVGVLTGLGVGITFAFSISKSIVAVTDRLSENVEQVSSASVQIASSSTRLSEASTEQTASLDETAASLEQITAMIAKAAANADSTASSSAESQQKAKEGRTAVGQMLTSMDEISASNAAIMEQVNESNQQMTEIVGVINEIGEKTKVINEIVFQTKLLSFNASVEAARAGEHGKGFAVVAEEVGNLARMSGNAAKEISDMLNASILRVEKIAVDTRSKVEVLVGEGRQKVESGTLVAQQCSAVLEDIVVNVERVSNLAQEISRAGQEQAQGVSEINKAMGLLDQVTQQNAATSEEAAASAEVLSAQAEALKGAVWDLVKTVQGDKGHVVQVGEAPPMAASPTRRARAA